MNSTNIQVVRPWEIHVSALYCGATVLTITHANTKRKCALQSILVVLCVACQHGKEEKIFNVGFVSGWLGGGYHLTECGHLWAILLFFGFGTAQALGIVFWKKKGWNNWVMVGWNGNCPSNLKSIAGGGRMSEVISQNKQGDWEGIFF